MKFRSATALLLGLILVAACSGGEKSSPTGSVGSSSLSGKILLAGDLAGQSPAGIEVRAKGTGIAASTDAMGNFALNGTPSGSVELAFTRPGDGINASSTLNGNASGVVVQLSRSRAVVLSAGNSKVEIEGLITAVSDASITVNDARTHADVTALITPDTIIRKGNATVLAADLAIGDRVHVRAGVGADNVLTALEIKLQNPGDDSPAGSKQEIEGLITEVSADSITVNDASTHGEVTAKITDATIIRKGNTTLTPEDLAIGDRVHVRAQKNEDGTLTALEIKLQNPGDDDGDDEGNGKVEIEGLITDVSADSITVNDASTHGDVTAEITADTKIRKGNTVLLPTDLKI
ncbi:MAG: DUF5666 domain-containing protein, partial [Thermoanaerobaculia bacterium]